MKKVFGGVIARSVATRRSIFASKGKEKMDRRAALAMTVMGMLFAQPLYALAVEQPLREAQAEARARALFSELRCTVCEAQSVVDSPAEVARDIRRNVRMQVEQGKTDEEIKQYLVAQYGEGVLMAPPVDQKHVLLWFAPALFLLVGAGFVFHSMVRKDKA